MPDFNDPYWEYLLDIVNSFPGLLLYQSPQKGWGVTTLESLIELERASDSSDIETRFRFREQPDEQSIEQSSGQSSEQPDSQPNKQLGQSWIKTTLLAFIDSDACLSELFQKQDFMPLIDSGCKQVSAFPAILFRLKVLSLALPFQFDRALFCAAFSVLESSRSERSNDEFCQLFLCALTHDLGLLNVSRQSINHRVELALSFTHDSEYYHHVDGAVNFLVGIEGVDAKVIRGVAEHHERMDGTGYPKGLAGLRLNEFGQHIHLYDTLYSVYVEKYRPLNKTLADLSIIVELNAITHFGQVANQILQILQEGRQSRPMIQDESAFQDLYEKAVQLGKYIKTSTDHIQSFTQQVGFRHEDKKLLALQNAFFHIAIAMYRSHNDNSVLTFIENHEVKGEGEARYKAMEDIYFMMREICYHVELFFRQLREYSKNNLLDHIQPAIETTLVEMKETKRLN